MPRARREKSNMNLYHVILRGNNKQIIFADNDDYFAFLFSMDYVRQTDNVKIHAYCLMNNHIHMLIEEGDCPISDSVKKMEIRFVSWYNKKYDRYGVLFQGRYRSEAINDESYYLAVLRYIMQNPMNAYIEKAPGRYPWSSFFAYKSEFEGETDKEPHTPGYYAGLITFTETAMAIFNGRKKLLDFLTRPSRDICLEHIPVNKMTTQEAMMEVFRLTGIKNHYDFMRLNIDTRNRYILILDKAGFSVKKINQLTGIPTNAILKVINRDRSPSEGTDLH